MSTELITRAGSWSVPNWRHWSASSTPRRSTSPACWRRRGDLHSPGGRCRHPALPAAGHRRARHRRGRPRPLRRRHRRGHLGGRRTHAARDARPVAGARKPRGGRARGEDNAGSAPPESA
ncbi:hypothetical protein NKH77_55580 [Streptomyces sp. M19]